MYQNIEYLGKGWDFPPTFNDVVGEVRMITAIEDIEKSLRTIVSTRRGERVMRPKFGCDLGDKVFENLNSTQLNDIRKRIEEAILLYEPRIDIKKLELNTENVLEGKLMILLIYVVRATNTRRNIVFPYYITEATDI